MEFHNTLKDIFFRTGPQSGDPVQRTLEYVENPPTDFADKEIEARLEMDPDKTKEQVAIDAALRYADAADPQSSVELLHAAGVDTATKLEVGIYAIEQQIEIARTDGGVLAASINPHLAEESLNLYHRALEQVENNSEDEFQLLAAEVQESDEISYAENQDTWMSEDTFFPVPTAAGDD